MERKNSIWVEAFFSYARVCARSIFLRIVLIPLLFFVPAFAVSTYDAAITELKSTDLKTQYDGLEKIKPFHTPEAAQFLVQSARGKSDANFRLAVLDQIAVLQIQSMVPLLSPLLNDKSVAIRQRTAHVVGLINGPLAESVLLPAIAKETDPGVKAALIQSLGLCGSAQSVAVLKAAAHDSNPAVRANAAYAHKRITGHEVK